MLSPSATYIVKRGLWTGLVAIAAFLLTSRALTVPITARDGLAVVVGFGLAWLAVELAAMAVAYRTTEGPGTAPG